MPIVPSVSNRCLRDGFQHAYRSSRLLEACAVVWQAGMQKTDGRSLAESAFQNSRMAMLLKLLRYIVDNLPAPERSRKCFCWCGLLLRIALTCPYLGRKSSKVPCWKILRDWMRLLFILVMFAFGRLCARKCEEQVGQACRIEMYRMWFCDFSKQWPLVNIGDLSRATKQLFSLLQDSLNRYILLYIVRYCHHP